MARVMRWVAMWVRHHRRKAILLVCLTLVAILALFEIGVRLLPADAAQYDIQTYFDGGIVSTQAGTITDPAAVTRWRVAMAAHPAGGTLVGTLIAKQRGEFMCSYGLVATASYVFLWHGLPIESVSMLPTCVPRFMISRGGIPDMGIYIIDPLLQSSQP